MNLIPEHCGTTPSYWCSWGIQNYTLGASSFLDPRQFVGVDGFELALNNLNQQLLFEKPGWASRYYEMVRGDLYLLLDVGWDLPYGVKYPSELWRFGSLIPDQSRFPVCQGDSVEQLAGLNRMAQAAGWRGVGLWVSPQLVGDGKDKKAVQFDQDELTQYCKERAKWCHEAGVNYWKVDIGYRSNDFTFRRLLTQQASLVAPDLVVEHATLCGPLNDEVVSWDDYSASGQGRYRSWADGQVWQKTCSLLEFSDVVRTYDVTAHLSVATTLDRVSSLLAFPPSQVTGQGILNCEDEPYLGAVLGCALGMMRHPLWKESSAGYSSYDPGLVRRRMDEVVRAVRWQRLAPAWGVSKSAPASLSSNTLTDSWFYRAGDTWASDYLNREITQSAPAMVGRGISLPQVVTRNGEKSPYIVASCHPNGAVALGALPRTTSTIGIHTPRASVSIVLHSSEVPIGIFGEFESLTLQLMEPLGNRRIWGQDLAGDEALDITGQVRVTDEALVFNGDLLAAVGRSAAAKGDISTPGIVLKLE